MTARPTGRPAGRLPGRPIRGGNAARLGDIEREIVRSALTGEPFEAAADLPTPDDMSCVVSAAVIRDALAGVYGPLHYRGLRLRGVRVAEDLDLSYLSWRGALGLEKCRVDGDVILSFAHPVGEVDFCASHVRTLLATGAFVEGSLLLCAGFRSEQGVRMVGARISDSLRLSDSHITGPQDNPRLCAVEMFRAHVGDLFLNRATIEGGVYALRVTVDQNIRLGGSTIRSRSAMGWPDESGFRGSASFATAQVGGTVTISSRGSANSTLFDGWVALGGASCATLIVQAETLARAEIRLGHFTYRRLIGVRPADLFDYVHRQEPFDSSSYTMLAQYCGSVGESGLQRQILFSMERRATRRLPRHRAARIRRLVFEYVVGYGYIPLRSLLWLSGSLVACTLLLRADGAAFLVAHAKTSGAGAPAWSNSVELALDNLLPFAALGVQSQWSVAAHGAPGWLGLAAFLVLKFGAWGLVALGLGSITGLLRNPS